MSLDSSGEHETTDELTCGRTVIISGNNFAKAGQRAAYQFLKLSAQMLTLALLYDSTGQVNGAMSDK